MSCNFGNIEYVEVKGNEIHLTGHRYVGLALDRDDPYIVTRFVDVQSDDLGAKKIDDILHASDVYDSEIVTLDEGILVRFLINDSVEVSFHCKEISEGSRYYNRGELQEIFRWLPSKCSSGELNAHIAAVNKHGFSVAFLDGTVVAKSL